MVAMNTLDGLIVTTRKQASRPLVELAEACGWPALLGASARGLLREFSLQIPACVLFWLEDWDSIAATAQLIEWLRERNAEPFRVAVACNVEAGTEAVLRAAGAHSVLPVTGQSGAAIARALGPLLQSATRNGASPVAAANSPIASRDHVSPTKFASDPLHPP
ncbi:MAG TPA: hypothetical protein VGM76_08635 [Lacipirellulaceae bacterium]|jgi:hypothetical protein